MAHDDADMKRVAYMQTALFFSRWLGWDLHTCIWSLQPLFYALDRHLYEAHTHIHTRSRALAWQKRPGLFMLMIGTSYLRSLHTISSCLTVSVSSFASHFASCSLPRHRVSFILPFLFSAYRKSLLRNYPLSLYLVHRAYLSLLRRFFENCFVQCAFAYGNSFYDVSLVRWPIKNTRHIRFDGFGVKLIGHICVLWEYLGNYRVCEL